MDPTAHWEKVYREKRPELVSWFQPEARLSRALIEQAAPDHDAGILDVGAGASTLVDGLLAAGYRHVTLLDLSPTALALTRSRLGAKAGLVAWIEGDVLHADLPAAGVDLWHDRAVFHFLTSVGDRARYVAQVRRALRPGGHLLVATFAEDGPTRCSGLEVARYGPAELAAAFGDEFRLLVAQREEHRTPGGAPQAFTYCLCRYSPRPAPG